MIWVLTTYSGHFGGNHNSSLGITGLVSHCFERVKFQVIKHWEFETTNGSFDNQIFQPLHTRINKYHFSQRCICSYFMYRCNVRNTTVSKKIWKDVPQYDYRISTPQHSLAVVTTTVQLLLAYQLSSAMQTTCSTSTPIGSFTLRPNNLFFVQQKLELWHWHKMWFLHEVKITHFTNQHYL